MTLHIEDYALIGDCETAALVGRDGSINWLCWPNFSSPACFASLLGDKTNGRWLLATKEKPRRVTRRYREHTLILETIMETRTGKVMITDFMPVRGIHSDVVRIVRCMEGKVGMQMELCVRFDYGRTVPWISRIGKSTWVASAGEGRIYLRTGQKLHTQGTDAYSSFTLAKGESRSFCLTYAHYAQPTPRWINTRTALRETEEFWRTWTRRNRYKGPYAEAVERSLITLKALTYRSTGGIVAAPTTSLPERLGGDRNWDYRYCWLRDAAFTLDSLLTMGYQDEAEAWQRWLLQSVGNDLRQLQILYGMCGERHLPEIELPWLPGFRNSSPVRTGNAATEQLQLDVYGELADALANIHRAGIAGNAQVSYFRQQITARVAEIYNQKTSSIWEGRSIKAHFTYSLVMCWLALDHGVRAVERHEISGPLKEWKRKRDQIRRRILRDCYNKHIRSFVQRSGSRRIDASSLLLPIFGFLPYTDERVRNTVRAIEKDLTVDGLVKRYDPVHREYKEAAFLACSFWLVENLAGVGRKRDARRLFERLLKLQNDVGLLAEEYDPATSHFLGNFPQALSHIALINAARALDAQ